MVVFVASLAELLPNCEPGTEAQAAAARLDAMLRRFEELAQRKEGQCIVFLNQKDLFEARLETRRFADYFPAFPDSAQAQKDLLGGRMDPETAILFIRNQFE